jgi:hypothetical protein
VYKITFKQTPNMFSGRNGQVINAIVHHRMIGFLAGTDIEFLNPTTEHASHFGIGYRNGIVEISQYADLSDSPWANGNYDPSGGWTLVKKTSTGTVINPNYYTVSIEHEDGGPSDGRVSEPVLAASLWLDTILLSGDPIAIRGVGIRMRDDIIATQLKNILPGTETLIDHNRISGKLKPTCWRPYMQDTQGFIPGWQPRLLAAIGGSRMAIQDTLTTLNAEVNKLIADKAVTDSALTLANTKLAQAKANADSIITNVGSIQTSLAVIADAANKIKTV